MPLHYKRQDFDHGLSWPSYSTLEVLEAENRNIHDHGGAYKEAVSHPTSLYPQQVPFEIDRSDVYGPQVVYEQSLPDNTPTAYEEVASKTNRICGLSRRKFYLTLALGLLIIIGAVAGGVAGGLSNRQHDHQENPDAASNPNTSNSSSAQSSTNILSISKLSSTNRTDSNGYAHRKVFFQDPYNAIVARRWDSQNRTWATSNLTELMRGSATPLNPLPGTPLASASCSWNTVNEVYLWFLVPDNYISSLWLTTPDTDPDNWVYEVNGGPLDVRPGSQLAGMWQRCWADDCIGNWLVAYQTPGGDVNVANASHWETPGRALEGKSVAVNSSLGLAPQLDGVGVDRVVLVSEAVSSVSTSDLQKAEYVGEWGSNSILLTDIPQPSPRLQFAVTVLNNFQQTLFLALLPNGTVTATWYNDEFIAIPSVRFSGGPTADIRFTAIAVSEDAMFYGISGDAILEYEPDGADPPGYRFSSTVYP